MAYNKNTKLITLDKVAFSGKDFYVTVISLFGAIFSLVINYKHYEWVFSLFLKASSSVVVIAFIGVFYIAILVLLILYISLFAIIGYYFTKLLCTIILNIIKH